MKYNARERNPNWQGGSSVVNGYIHILHPHHPKANYNGYVREHILIAEKVLGKVLPDRAVVHHGNAIKDDNKNSNLVICENQDYHKLLHKRLRALNACGHNGWVKCRECKQHDDPSNMIIFYKRRNIFIHRECRNKRSLENYYKRKEVVR